MKAKSSEEQELVFQHQRALAISIQDQLRGLQNYLGQIFSKLWQEPSKKWFQLGTFLSGTSINL